MLKLPGPELLYHDGAGPAAARPAAELGTPQSTLRANKVEEGSTGVGIFEDETGTVEVEPKSGRGEGGSNQLGQWLD